MTQATSTFELRGPTEQVQAAGEPLSFPTSFAQQRLWFLHYLEPGEGTYNLPITLRLEGPLDAGALEASLNEIVRRHDVLRTSFPVREGIPVQVIAPHMRVDLQQTDLQELGSEAREREASRLASVEVNRPFDLATGPVLRAKVLRLAEEDHVLILTMHHIVSDGWSLDVLMRELAALYDAFRLRKPSPLPELPIQYADYALSEKEWLRGDVLDSQLAYWKQQLSGIPALLELPTDFTRAALQSTRGSTLSATLPPDLLQGLKALARREGATLFMTLLAAFHALLFRYTGQEDIPVGSPIAGRTQVETEGLIGFFVNTLVLRGDLSGDPSFRKLLARVRDVTLGAYAHQDLPFEKLVEVLRPERDISYTPLFQVMFAFQNAPLQSVELPGLKLRPVAVHTGTAKFDLTLELAETEEGLRAELEYSTDLFDPPTARRMAGHFETLLAAIVTDPGRRISHLSVLTPEESGRLLVDWNDTAADYPRDRSLHELFEAQAARTPDQTAYVFDGKSLTYRDLNRRANQLARRLRSLGVGPGVPVGIFLERSFEMIVGVLATLKAGGAYVPLDPSYPGERLAFMLEDAAPPVVLTTSRLAPRLPERKGGKVVEVGPEAEIPAESEAANPVSGVRSEDPAYIIYTSGSTGLPKGVVGLHRGAVNRLHWMWKKYPFESGEVCCQKTSLGFIDSMWEIFGPPLAGVETVLLPDEVVRDTRRLIETLSGARVTRIVLVPSLLAAILDSEADLAASLPRLKYWVSSGEALPPDLVRRFRERLPMATLLNLYGSSEVSADATFFDTSEAPFGFSVPIGRPLWNTRIYVLDKALQPAPVGVPGEIHVGGDGVARGYWNRPRLTAERFVPDTFSGEAGAKLYKTGDLARYRPDGHIEYLGRKDHQVKIRGQRVELGEVETALRTHPGIREGVATIRPHSPGDNRIVAYFVPSGERAPSLRGLRTHLASKLPDYMIPSAFVALDALPRTPSGKVDRRRLPSPGEGRPELEKECVAPRNEAERRLVQIWARALRVQPVGVTDNFFELGGHSLLAVRLFAQIERAFGGRIPLATIFQAPTVRELAAVLEEKNWSALWASLVPIQSRGSRTPFYCVHAVGGNVLTYADLARHLGPDQPVYGLQAQGLDGKAVPHPRIEDMAEHYVAEILKIQPEGPYHLGGSSFGGLVAYEVAQQLHAQGHKVGVLALFDTWGPDYLQHMPSEKNPYYRIVRFIERVDLHLGNFLAAEGAKAKLGYLKVKAKRAKRRISWRADRFSRRLEKLLLPRALRKVESTSMRARNVYVPRVYPGKITLFRASKQPAGVFPDPHLGWAHLAAGGVEVYEVPGYHGAIVYEPRVRILAEQLRLALRRADESDAMPARRPAEAKRWSDLVRGHAG